MSMSRIIRVIDSAFAGEIAGGGVIGVGFAVQAARLARDGGIRQAVERVVAEGLRLRARQGIRDGADVAHRVVRVGVVLQASCRNNF